MINIEKHFDPLLDHFDERIICLEEKIKDHLKSVRSFNNQENRGD